MLERELTVDHTTMFRFFARGVGYGSERDVERRLDTGTAVRIHRSNSVAGNAQAGERAISSVGLGSRSAQRFQ